MKGTKQFGGVVLGVLLSLFYCPAQLWGQQVQTASKEASRVKISGYVQTQWQVGDSLATPQVGTVLDRSSSMISRIGIRRGRVKLSYTRGITDAIFSLDLTERGVRVKDAYLALSLPSLGQSSLTLGLFSTPFGYEVAYSSSKRESPERSTVVRTLFPGERNLGLHLALQASKSSVWHPLKMDLALLSGNGVSVDMDNSPDFLARLSAEKSFFSGILSGACGISGYWGSVPRGSAQLYQMMGAAYERVDPSETGNRARVARTYGGIDVQGRLRTLWGEMRLASEVILGTQPSAGKHSKSPEDAILPKDDLYLRPFWGGYIQLSQSIGKSPWTCVGKYEWYDPNRQLANGESRTLGDRASRSWGMGILWDLSSSLRLLAYYQQNWMEQERRSGVEPGLSFRDQLGTIRLQYKF